MTIALVPKLPEARLSSPVPRRHPTLQLLSRRRPQRTWFPLQHPSSTLKALAFRHNGPPNLDCGAAHGADSCAALTMPLLFVAPGGTSGTLPTLGGGRPIR